MENKQIQKQKKWFDIKINAMIPATIIYKVLAEDEHEALTLIKNKQPNSIQYKFFNRKELKIMIYDSGSCIIRYVKHLLGK